MLTDGTDAQQTLVHQKGSFAWQWLGNANMHMYAKFKQNIPYGSRVMNVFTNYLRMEPMLSKPSSI